MLCQITLFYLQWLETISILSENICSIPLWRQCIRTLQASTYMALTIIQINQIQNCSNKTDDLIILIQIYLNLTFGWKWNTLCCQYFKLWPENSFTAFVLCSSLLILTSLKTFLCWPGLGEIWNKEHSNCQKYKTQYKIFKYKVNI